MSRPAALEVPFKIVSHQLMLLLAIGMLAAVALGGRAGTSLILGSLVAWLPMKMFVRMVFSNFVTPKLFLVFFMCAEAIKLSISAGLLVWVLTHLSVDFFYVCAGWGVGLVAFWVSSLFCMDRSV